MKFYIDASGTTFFEYSTTLQVKGRTVKALRKWQDDVKLRGEDILAVAEEEGLLIGPDLIEERMLKMPEVQAALKLYKESCMRFGSFKSLGTE